MADRTTVDKVPSRPWDLKKVKRSKRPRERQWHQKACCDLTAYSTSSPDGGDISDRQKRLLGQRLIFLVEDPILTPSIRRLLTEYYVGNATLKTSNFEDAAQASHLIQELQSLAKDSGHSQPLLIGFEHEYSLVSKVKNGFEVTRFPSALGLTACQPPQIIKSVGEALSKELSTIGINWVYDPVLDAVTDLTEPLDASRRFGVDAETVGSHALAFTRGLHANRVASCAIETLAATIEEVYTSMTREELGDDAARATEQEELESLERLIGEGCLDSLQLASSLHGLQDPTQLGRSIQTAIRLILRERLDFEGPVIFDCSTLPSESITCPKHAPLRALLGDCDMVRLSDDHNTQIASIQAIYAAAKADDLSDSTTAAAAARVSKLKDHCTSWDIALAARGDLSAVLSANAGLAQAAYRASITALSKDPTPLLNLPPTSVLVLFSPTVLSPSNPASAAVSDPFEPLGLALARSHSRIRHVPYTVSAGLTGTHMTFLSRSMAVVLVLCNASSAFTEAQKEFTSAVRRAVHDRESALPGTETIRKVVVGAGDPRDLRGDWGQWWGLCCYEYTRSALEAVAEVIVGDRVATGVLPIS